MYMDYTKLWKLLIDKGISKTELMELCGISSRVLAKLSKNQTVTTDTIARICAVLNCDVGDIMEYATESELSFYHYFRKYGTLVEKGERIKTFSFTKGDRRYTVYKTVKAAVKSTHIHCKSDKTVYWEQLYPLGGVSTPSFEESVLIKPAPQKDETCIVVITGKPGIITGLDEGSFVSSRGKPKRESDVYVMSETAFKLFSPVGFEDSLED